MPALKRSGLLKMKGKVLSFEEFERLVDSLFENGYTNVNGAITQLSGFMGYKAWHQIEEFENLKTHEKIQIEFIKELVNGRISYYIKDIEVS